MPESTSDSTLNIRGLILVPAVITLGITLLRLGGELAHWSPRFFSAEAGGGLAVVGISWLPFLFGPYFALKLARSGHGASSVWKAFGLSLLGLAVMIVGGFVGFAPQLKFPGREILGILLVVLGPTLVTLGWPALFKVLVVYGYAARIPVAIVMLFALRGHWGTHYDALPPNYSGPTSFFGQYLVMAFLPQMVVWIAFTVLMGALVGSIVAALVFRGKTMPAAT
jgi:heme exporter protein D